MQTSILTQRPEELKEFAAGLGGEIIWKESLEAVLEGASKGSWNLVVLDGAAQNVEIRAALIQLLSVNAMLATAVITETAEDDFHEQTEGLGVLCAIPASPEKIDGQKLRGKLEQVSLPT